MWLRLSRNEDESYWGRYNRDTPSTGALTVSGAVYSGRGNSGFF
jgi:hypothetical protein